MYKNKFFTRVLENLEESPIFLKDFFYFYFDEENTNENSLKRIVAIKSFLEFLANELGTPSKSLTLEHLEQIELAVIQKYVTTGPFGKLNRASKKYYITTLSSFWNFFTNDSFTLERGKPIFYRNAINEWKIAFKSTYDVINGFSSKIEKNNVTAKDETMLSEKDFLDILMFIDHYFILTLDNHIKVENWKKSQARDLAIIALLMGTGITREEISRLNLRDIDMRSKSITVWRNNATQTIPIQAFAVPYITPYVSWRRKWWVADRSQQALFINNKNERVSTTFFSSIISKFNQAYPDKSFSAKILRDSHGKIIYDQTGGNLEQLRNIQGYRNLNSLARFIIN